MGVGLASKRGEEQRGGICRRAVHGGIMRVAFDGVACSVYMISGGEERKLNFEPIPWNLICLAVIRLRPRYKPFSAYWEVSRIDAFVSSSVDLAPLQAIFSRPALALLPSVTIRGAAKPRAWPSPYFYPVATRALRAAPIRREKRNSVHW